MMSNVHALTILARSRDFSLASERKPTSDQIREASETLGFGSHMLCESRTDRGTKVDNSKS